MFGGIIQAIGEVRACRETAGGYELVVRAADGFWQESKPGDSIAVEGVCLTLTHQDGPDAGFDVITETLRRSTLIDLRPGDAVNLQKALSVGDRIDGHFIQGHVDAVSTVVAIEASAAESVWWFSKGDDVARYIVPKGAVAIDGISLTVANVQPDRFSVALIPTTIRETTLARKRVGSRVNVETDIIARTVVHYLESLAAASDPTGRSADMMDLLRRHGFA